MSNELTVISRENVSQIASMAPQAYQDNKSSHDKCIAAGQALIDKIQAAGKMDDELDKEAAAYLEKVRKTVKKMNDSRSPLTKLFDEYRKIFTTMENEVDPGKSGTVPAQLQALRNKFAEEKRAAELRRQQEEYRRQQAENARKLFRADCDAEYRRLFSMTLNAAINTLTDINSAVTLDNYTESYEKIKSFNCTLPDDWSSRWGSSIRRPLEIPAEEVKQIQEEVRQSLIQGFREQYTFDVEGYRDDFINRLPSKKKELEAIAKSNAEEAERRRQEIAAREAEEARRKEEERKAREAEEAQRKEIEKKNAEMDGLFGQAAVSAPVYQPKTSVKKKINILNIEGYVDVFSMWWSNYAAGLSKEELDKAFKTQITFCEKLANDKANALFIKSEHIEYVDDVKAR